MIGLLFISLVAAYIAIAAFAVTRFRPRSRRIIAAVVLAILPFVEVTAARVRFEHLCKSAYGLKGLSPMPHYTHLELRPGVEGGEADYLERFGWLTEVSNERSDGMFVILKRGDKGVLAPVISQDLPMQRLVIERESTVDWLNIRRTEFTLSDSTGPVALVRARTFVYFGDFLARAFSVHGTGTAHDWSCGPRFAPSDVLKATNDKAVSLIQSEDSK